MYIHIELSTIEFIIASALSPLIPAGYFLIKHYLSKDKEG